MLKIEICHGKIYLPFVPEEDIADGIHLTLKEDFLSFYTRKRIHVTQPMVKGRSVYDLPPRVRKRDIYSIALVLPIEEEVRPVPFLREPHFPLPLEGRGTHRKT